MNLKTALAATVIVVSISATACGSSPTHSAASPTTVKATEKRHTTVDGYAMGQDAKSAVLTRMNSTGVIGDVEQIGDPVVLHLSDETLKATHTPADDSVNNLVSTPVSVRVTERLFGDDQVGDVVTLRILGGETGDAVTTAEQSSLLSKIEVGSSVAIFGGKAVTFSDGSTQITPDQVFVADADRFVSALVPDAPDAAPTTLGELRDLTRQREEWIAAHQK